MQYHKYISLPAMISPLSAYAAHGSSGTSHTHRAKRGKECKLESHATGEGSPVKDQKICQTMGNGMYTFVMSVTTAATKLAECTEECEAQDDFNMIATDTGFYILDHDCGILGSYTPDYCDDDEGTPYTIQGGFLDWTLIIDEVNMVASTGAGGARYEFRYGDGKYSIGNNHCTCNSVENGNPFGSTVVCGCAFPKDGNAR